MTTEPKGIKSVPLLSWVGAVLLLAGLVIGWGRKPFVQETLGTMLWVVGQLLFYGPMLLQSWRVGRISRLAAIVLMSLFVVSSVFLIWGTWDLWQAEQIMRRRGL
ncbi:hypothetical protein [Deinococcus enclensis]|uniref:Uncharacterized protein n=1 Tax=Deinococcus enclensis TaxID=1049582 RepID=A0ABT9MB94_9DEIO|nr:hypothetical protein [Deinococcus enclensis]MDP9763862.1 hypothetical protein [Deinococcus enclensis]